MATSSIALMIPPLREDDFWLVQNKLSREEPNEKRRRTLIEFQLAKIALERLMGEEVQ